MEFLKQVMPVQGRNLQDVLNALSKLQDLVVVRIAGSAEMLPLPLSNENLQAVLATSPESLCLEGLAPAKYRKWARTHIDLATSTTQALRGMLRTSFIGDLAGQVQAFLDEMERFAMQFEAYALQYRRSGVSDDLRRLRGALSQLAVSSFEYGDNVRCMDDLQYQLLPVLRKLHKVFGK